MAYTTSKDIYLDIHKNAIPVIYAKQYDNIGRNLVFKFLDRKYGEVVEDEIEPEPTPVESNTITT